MSLLLVDDGCCCLLRLELVADRLGGVLVRFERCGLQKHGVRMVFSQVIGQGCGALPGGDRAVLGGRTMQLPLRTFPQHC